MSNARFSIIPAWIVTDPRLKGIDLKVLCLLGSFTNAEGWCRRSQVKMADELNCGRSTVQGSLNRLYEIGVVEKRIVESRDGRDSAHYYRVIHDRNVSSDAIAAWQAAATEENDPNTDANADAPPATISAGGANSGMAPPAISGPAPINDTSLTNNLNDRERAPARGNLGDEEENPKAVEAAFKRFFIGWKTAISDSEPEARKEWLSLSPDERGLALEHSEAYQAAALSIGRKHLCSAAKYLKEQRWTKLSQPKPVSPQAESSETFTVFSRAGRAMLMSKLMLPIRPLSLTPLEQHIVDNKPEKSDLIWREKRERHGWPEAVQLIERRRFTVMNRIIEISKDFEKVAVGGEVWEAWKRAYSERCWPWPVAPEVLEFAQFPPLPGDIVDLDEAVFVAIENFKSRLNEGRNDDAA
ncbi:helix-turn-helix domain-containing protein [Agrobacterium tumefaciens]|uniref:helix-turn-helix domain-containing protein n=1 Tax=Agrobacterium tumefaciens TaxID=358 RepID=UPI001574A38F|nr:helix-turn-helix domain-containing protein [Agrobacterium tumefaciens]WCK12358.1 helix-turn-helix domain-containing protein [Agrobacterium tumefaciens]